MLTRAKVPCCGGCSHYGTNFPQSVWAERQGKATMLFYHPALEVTLLHHCQTSQPRTDRTWEGSRGVPSVGVPNRLVPSGGQVGGCLRSWPKKRSEPCTYLMTQNWRLRNKMSIGFRAGTGLSSSNSYKEDGVAQEWGCRWGAEEVRGNRVRLDYAGHWPSEWVLDQQH